MGRDWKKREAKGTPFDPPERIKCPNCDGDLIASVNLINTLVFLECQGECKWAWEAPLEKRMSNRFLQLQAALKEHSIEVRPPDQEFTLSSGAKSRVYCDLKKTALRADCQHLITDILELVVPKVPDAFAGVALGGCHLASLAGTHFGKNVLHVRKASKDHGTKKLVEAPGMPEGATVVLLEDVTTTAGSARKALQALREEGYNVTAIVTIVDRQAEGVSEIDGVPFYACTKLQAIMGPEASLV